MKKLTLILFSLFFLSCKEEIIKPTQNEQLPKLQICDIPLTPVTDTNGILSSTSYDTEVQPADNRLPPIGLILLQFGSTRISSPYWNGNVPFTTKQVITDSSKMRVLVSFANGHYSSWRVRFTIDNEYFTNFVGHKDTLNVVSNMILSEGSTTETNLLPYTSGVAYINGLFIPQVNHGFVFANIFPNTRYKTRDIGSIIIHESGHMVGLSHQSEYDANCSKINEYRTGCFMGNPFYPATIGWTIGPSNRGCSTIQNDTLSLNNSLGKVL